MPPEASPSGMATELPKALTETTPLLAVETAVPSEPAPEVNSNGTTDAPGAAAEDEDRPLPRGQMALLFFARSVEPIAFFSIFPFVAQMIRDTGSVREKDVGFYAGLIESLFSLTQMLCMISWGWAADHLGRRPVMIVSYIGIALGSASFGFSTTVWQMIMCRCFTGLFAGSSVTVRALFSDNSTPKTQTRAFSLFAVAGNLGIFLGPLIGGTLADPTHQYPKLFGHVEFFERYPYGLPALVSGGISLTCALFNVLFLKETLKKSPDNVRKQRPMSTLELLRSPGVGIVLFIFSYNTAVALAYTAVNPVFWFTRPELGGYGLSPAQMSLFLAVGGLSQALWTLLLYPTWQKRVGTGRTLRFLYTLYPIMLGLCPVPSIIRRTTGNMVAFYLTSYSFIILGSSIAMTFTGVQLALNDIAPSHDVIGMLNAIALSIVSGARACVPAIFGSIFAVGVRQEILWGYLVWAVLAVLACVLSIALCYMPAKAYGGPRLDKATAADDEELLD